MRYDFKKNNIGMYCLYDSNNGVWIGNSFFDEVTKPIAVNNISTLNVMFSRIVIKDGKCGVFSVHPKKLSITIPCEYDEILYDYFVGIEGGWVLKKNNKKGVYSISEKRIILSCDYDEIESAPSAWLIQKNGLWGVYDIKLRKVTLPCICDQIIITEHECKVLRGEEWHTLQR